MSTRKHRDIIQNAKKNLKVMPMAVFSKDFVSSLKHKGK